MSGRPNWSEDARVYSGGDKTPPQGEDKQEALKQAGRGIGAGVVIGGGIEVLLELIPGIGEMPYCAKEDILYRLATGVVTAALLMPLDKKGEEVEKYGEKAWYSGIGYAVGTIIMYGGLEILRSTYEKL